MKPDLCNASPQGIGHAGEYGKIGISPCRAYVAHESNKPCDLINNPEEDFTNECDCYGCKCTCGGCCSHIPGSDNGVRSGCTTSLCPCGEFLSHKVFEPCTAKP